MAGKKTTELSRADFLERLGKRVMEGRPLPNLCPIQWPGYFRNIGLNALTYTRRSSIKELQRASPH